MHCQLARSSEMLELSVQSNLIAHSGQAAMHANWAGLYPLIFILVGLLAKQQLIDEHAKGIHIALHAQLTPIQRLRRVHVLRPVCHQNLFKAKPGCNACTANYRASDTCFAMQDCHSATVCAAKLRNVQGGHCIQWSGMGYLRSGSSLLSSNTCSTAQLCTKGR